MTPPRPHVLSKGAEAERGASWHPFSDQSSTPRRTTRSHAAHVVTMASHRAAHAQHHRGPGFTELVGTQPGVLQGLPGHLQLTSEVTPPTPTPWTPKFVPEEWVYTDGSDIKGQPRLGAAVVHIPTRTTIYIDATGCEETNTIMRAELVAIHTALATFEDHTWVGIFTDSLSSIQAIRLHFTRPGLSIAPHYHHHMLLIQSICHLLETRREKGYPTTIRNIRAHTHIKGNDLADAAAKRVVADWNGIPANQKLNVTIGRQAERPPYWVMYTKTPLTPPIQLATGPLSATLRQPWWTIPEKERLCMHAFTHPSKQLRQKVRAATLRSLHHTSVYRRLILNAKARGARTANVGTALHSRIRNSPTEGITILKFLYGQLYNGKLAYIYGLDPTDACPLCGLPGSCTHIAGQC